MAFEKLIYLASPYSHQDPKVQAGRFAQACEATARLQDQGHLIFSPIVHSHYCVPFTEKQGGAFSDWEALDKAFIDRCDEVWVLYLPEWDKSKGVEAEIKYAHAQGKPQRGVSFPDLNIINITATDAQDQADGFAFDFPLELEGPIVSATPKQTIIGLTGHAQSGKDTAGRYLVENHGFTRIGFADAVKDCLYWLNPVVEWNQCKDRQELNFEDGQLEHFYIAQSETRLRQYTETRRLVDHFGWEKSKQLSHFRQLLQRMGTEVGREIISPTIWLDIAHNKIAELGPEAKVVITDVRFPNEVGWVRALGGEVWEVQRQGVGPVNDHASDQKLSDDLIDGTVFNNGTLQEMYNLLDQHVQA